MKEATGEANMTIVTIILIAIIVANGLIDTGRLKRGDTILLIVPESGRFSCGTALLRCI